MYLEKLQTDIAKYDAQKKVDKLDNTKHEDSDLVNLARAVIELYAMVKKEI